MWTPNTLVIALAALLLLPLRSSAAGSSGKSATSPLPATSQATPETLQPSAQGPAPAIIQDEPTGASDVPASHTPPHGAQLTPSTPRIPGTTLPGTTPNKGSTILRPDTPLKSTTPDPRNATAVTRTISVTEDGAASITLSNTALNRVLFPEIVITAYTATDALEVIIEGRAVIVSFRSARPADLMVVTPGLQYLLRLVPDTLPAQTIRLRVTKTESHLTSSYETQLADLIEAGYRRTPPEGFQRERPARPLPATGALAWYLTLQYRGHQFTLQEYAVTNTGALPHPLDPTQLARLFPSARALSPDPLLLQPGAWGRVLVVVQTDTLDPAEGSK